MRTLYRWLGAIGLQYFRCVSNRDAAVLNLTIHILPDTLLHWWWEIDLTELISVVIKHDFYYPLQWRHNRCDGVSNHRRLYCLLSRLFRHWSKKTSKLRVTGLCEGNSPVTGEFPAQRASSAEIFPFDDVIRQTYAWLSSIIYSRSYRDEIPLDMFLLSVVRKHMNLLFSKRYWFFQGTNILRDYMSIHLYNVELFPWMQIFYPQSREPGYSWYKCYTVGTGRTLGPSPSIIHT